MGTEPIPGIHSSGFRAASGTISLLNLRDQSRKAGCLVHCSSPRAFGQPADPWAVPLRDGGLRGIPAHLPATVWGMVWSDCK